MPEVPPRPGRRPATTADAYAARPARALPGALGTLPRPSRLDGSGNGNGPGPERNDAERNHAERIDTERIDPGQIEGLAELQAPDGGSLLAAFVSSFSRQADRRLGRIRDCADRADDGELVMAAHELRGSAATIGAVRVASLCAELEQGGAGALGRRPGLLDDLADELGLAVHELDAIVRGAT